jgi:dienelactone hydrolase
MAVESAETEQQADTRPRWRRRILRALPYIVLLTILVLVTPPGRVALKSGGLLLELFPDAPVSPLRWFTSEPRFEIVSYPVEDGEMAAHLYRPAGGGQHGALVFYIGVGPEHDNEHLVRFSTALARAGIIVLIPISEDMVDFRVEPGEEEGAIGAFEYLRTRDDVAPDRIGFLGLSVGASVGVMAAQDARIRDDVRVVDSFGGYYSAHDMLSALVLRQIEVDGEWEAWQPSSVPVNVFMDTLLARLPEEDRAPLEPLFTGEEMTIPDGLSTEGQAAAELLINRDPERMPELMANLPDEWHDYLHAISPATNIENLRADTLLMHSRDDNIIPFTESLRFYDEAEQAQHRDLTIIRIFRHVEPQTDEVRAVVVDGWRLYSHIFSLLNRLS